jgi:uncharacterized membrane protein YqgA involved in biofilm formation
MKHLTDIGLVALGLVAGVVVGQLLQYHQKRIEEFINKIFKKKI